MLPKRLRLPRAAFASLKTQKALKRLTSSVFSLTAAPAAPKKAGIAVVIGAKAAPRAVDRHRLKRQVSTLLRPYAAKDLAIIVHARPGAAKLSFADLRAEVQDLADRALLSR